MRYGRGSLIGTPAVFIPSLKNLSQSRIEFPLSDDSIHQSNPFLFNRIGLPRYGLRRLAPEVRVAGASVVIVRGMGRLSSQP
jgi:hypothetical protein